MCLNRTGMKLLYPPLRFVLQILCSIFSQKLWEDKWKDRIEGILYPDFATHSMDSFVGIQPDFTQFRLLFEVECQIVTQANSSVLVSSGETGIGQFLQWLYQEEKHTLKYGAATDYEYWVFLKGEKREDGLWNLYQSKPYHFHPTNFQEEEDEDFEPTVPGVNRALRKLCELFVWEKASWEKK